ncbi:MAG: hypothetical protein ACKO5Q_24860 [Microcystaceae cyanobacterium]
MRLFSTVANRGSEFTEFTCIMLHKFCPAIVWLSPLADPLAVLRIYLSAQQQPKQWRGRIYGA